jgi:competence protein ComEC
MKGNNGSCVVMVSDGNVRILLTGDVEAEAELAMLKRRWGTLHADIIQVPHHGSRTSSSAPLLRAVAGSAALSSSSRYNAWHLPSAKVVQRYQSQGYKWYDTAQSGQLTIDINSDKWQINSFRAQISPRWYHQWFGVSRDNG